MAADEKWYFTKEQLANTPSRKCGYEVDKELSYRQQAANFIQDMGQRLQVTQLCINTAIVYMHRFYVFHSFTHFHRNAMAAAALFLAAKVEEQPRKLEHVIKVAHMCLNRDQPQLDTKSEKYLEHAQDLVFNENVLLQTLGFDVAIDHPHTHVVRCCHLVRGGRPPGGVDGLFYYPITWKRLNELTASKDLAQTSYFMASNSLHLTTMCLQYKPTVVACFCIHLACKWSNWEIPQSNEGKDWFWYVDKTVSLEQLEQLTAEFLVIFDKCPTKLKRKIMSISATQNPTLPPPMTGSLFDMEPRKIRPPDGSQLPQDGPTFHSGILSGNGGRPLPHHSSHMQGEAVPKPLPEKVHQSSSVPGTSGAPQQRVDYRDYKEKKERERLAQQGAPRESHHATPHMSKSMPSNSGKHGPVPPGMINKTHHRDHKHPLPMSSSSMRPPTSNSGSSTGGVTQARDAARREQAYSREAAKREGSNQRGGEYMFAPPVRHSEPQPLSEHITSHHSLPGDAPPPIGNHLGSGMNSGLNCNVSTRKDNQTHDWTSAEIPTNEMDGRHVSRDAKGVPPHVESSSKRSQQPGFESSSRHGRAPTDHRISASGSDGRVIKDDGRVSKEEVSSNSSMQKIASEMGDAQRHLYNHKHASASDRMDHNRHRRMGVNEQFPSRAVQSINEGITERKPNISEIVERKPGDLVDRKPTAHSLSELADRKPSVPDTDRKPSAADLPDRKIEVHPSFSENRHESSSRRQDGSKHQPVQSYHPALIKREIKAEPNTVKKEDVEHSGRVGSLSRPPPPPPPPPPVTPPPPLPQQQQPPPLQQPPLPPSNTAAVPSHHHSQERDRHKSRPRSPSQAHEKPPSQHPIRSRSPAIPPRAKSPVASSAPPLPNKRSDSPHGKLKPTPVTLPPSRNGVTLEEKPISRRPETPVNKQDHSAVTIKSEAEASSLKVSSGEKQKSSTSASHSTPEKAGITIPKESPYPRSKSTRQRTPPSSASKKAPPTPISEMPTTPLSPFGSPPPPTPTTPGSTSKLRSTNRHRTSSSSSEPELIPVVKKLDEIAGYENIIRDSKIGIKLPNRVPDIIPPIRDRNKKEESSAAPPINSGTSSRSNSNNVTSVAKELKPPDLIRPFPPQMLDASKPPGLPDDLGAVAFPESDSTNGTFSRTTIPPPSIASDEASIHSVGVIDISTVEENILPTSSSNLPTAEHHHKGEKKKKKKEHKEHKHKDKDKNREERKHRHKHKDKDKDRHKDKTEGSAPIKITIPKDKINLSSTLEPIGGVGLKLKIQKDRLKGSDSTGSSPQSAVPSGGLKIKISKEMIGSFNSSNTAPPVPNNETTPSSSRKRDRSSPRASELSTPPGPPTKSARLNTSTGEQRRGGSGSSNYGKQNGVEHHRRGGSHYSTPGNKVVQKLADCHNAYQSKGKSSSGSQP